MIFSNISVWVPSDCHQQCRMYHDEDDNSCDPTLESFVFIVLNERPLTAEITFLREWHDKCCQCSIHEDFLKLSVFRLLEKSVSEVVDNPVNLWEESRVEDELSPEEIQMVCHLSCHYSIFMLLSIDFCDSWEHIATLGWRLYAQGLIYTFTALLRRFSGRILS